MHLQGGYVIDEIFNLVYNQNKELEFESVCQLFSNLCHFELLGLEEELVEGKQSANKKLLVAYNIINRGNPTRASLFITEKILSQYDYVKTENKIGDIQFIRNSVSLINLGQSIVLTEINDKNRKVLYECIYVPIIVNQVQKTFLFIWLNEIFTVSREIKIHCNRDLKKYFDWAFTDLLELIEALCLLDDTVFEKPTLSFVEQKDIADFSLGINESGFTYQIKSTTNCEDVLDQVLTSKKIRYPAIGEYNRKNEFELYPEKHDALLYFLNNIFRKKSFREGQLAIINRILQCKDVIGILPTGSGKSLTYQLCTLLQPGVSIIIDPIRSLMIDQYDKLRQNFIDKVLYINSFDDKEQRNEKQDLLSKGKIQFAIIGPERFQILEFRNYMRDFVANKLGFSYSVIDEAHCISEWGHDFRYSYLRLSDGILRYCFNGDKEEFSQIALTATASFDVIADIERELRMPQGVLVSIPPEAIDRAELKFKIEKIPDPEFIDENAEFYIREKEVGRIKYPKIKEVVRKIPEDPFLALDANKKENFYSPAEGRYENCGLLFCPTKSDTLGNGVVANLSGFWTVAPYPRTFIEGLNTEPYLNCTTFMGQVEDGSVVAEVAANSFENQKDFLANRHNLMIATKAFGMGIDKPNIRYTIHYSIPQSVESFYQEAGRAGRDRENSINYIFYNQFDVETNKDFIKNAHKSFTRERCIYNEILTEVKYESKFFNKVVEGYLNEQFNKNNYGEKFNVYLSNKNPYLNIKNKANTVNYGFIRLNTPDLANEKRWITGIEDAEAETTLNEAKKCIKELFRGFDIEKSMRENRLKGLEETINETGVQKRLLNIGFENDVVEKLAELIPPYETHIINPVIDKLRVTIPAFQNIPNQAVFRILGKKLILDAYEFTNNEIDDKAVNKFISNIDFEYKRLVNYQVGGIYLTEDVINTFKKEYWKIRSEQDTMRAVYRLSIIGVVDDYVVNYRERRITVKFSGKPNEGYKANFKNYLRRYLGEQSTNKWIEKVSVKDENTDLRKYLSTLTDFFEETIAEKRLASAKFMDDLCKAYVQEDDAESAEKKFRESIVFYFTSKYANELLEKINTENEQDSFRILEFFLNKIENPPEYEVGLELNNAKHILGACQRIQSLGQINIVVNLLSSFCTILLEAKVKGHLPDFETSEIIVEQLETCLGAFNNLSQEENVHHTVYLNSLRKYSTLLNVIIPSTNKISQHIYSAASLYLLKNKLNRFNHKFLSANGRSN